MDDSIFVGREAELKQTPPDPSARIPFGRDADFVERGTILRQLDEKCGVPGSRTAPVGAELMAYTAAPQPPQYQPPSLRQVPDTPSTKLVDPGLLSSSYIATYPSSKSPTYIHLHRVHGN
jgi:hypothetical protein